ncbi:MAG: AI-2E family transporter [Actinomycetota bacterium]
MSDDPAGRQSVTPTDAGLGQPEDSLTAGMPPWIPRLILLIILSGFLAIGVAWLALRLHTLFGWLLISLFLSFALEPAVNFLARRGWRRGLATGFVMLVVFVAIVGLFVLVMPVFVKELTSFIQNLPQTLEKISSFTQKCCKLDLTDPNVLDKISGLGSAVKEVASNALAIGAYIVGLLLSFLSIATFTFFFLAYAPRVRRAVCSLFPPRRQEIVLHTWEVAIDKTGGYFYSRVLLAIVYSTVSFFVFSFLGVPFALVLAIFLGVVAELIPTIGPWIGGILPAAVALADDPKKGLYVIIYLFVYQMIENFTLVPKISARTMKMNPAMAFGAMIAGASVAGIMGMILALPVAGIIQTSFNEYLDRTKRRYEVIEDDMTQEPAPDDDDEDGPDKPSMRERLKEKVARHPNGGAPD